MSSWVGNPGRPPYVIPCGSAGFKKNKYNRLIWHDQLIFNMEATFFLPFPGGYVNRQDIIQQQQIQQQQYGGHVGSPVVSAPGQNWNRAGVNPSGGGVVPVQSLTPSGYGQGFFSRYSWVLVCSKKFTLYGGWMHAWSK